MQLFNSMEFLFIYLSKIGSTVGIIFITCYHSKVLVGHLHRPSLDQFDYIEDSTKLLAPVLSSGPPPWGL